MLKTSIPFVDLRGKTPIDLLRAYPDKAHALVDAACATYGIWSKLGAKIALPFTDRSSHAWLKRTRNPYLYEIETFAEILGVRGIYTFNIAYEWACTSGVYRDEDRVPMLRVLDWPFPGLGKHVMVVQQKAKAGEFYNVTWPGVSGVFTAMAPGRFSAALNEAPMRMHGLGCAGDWAKNRLLARANSGLPAAHLLRQVFEQADSYETARAMLMRTSITTPAIYILSGTRPGQGCVIERLENTAEVIELAAGQHVSAANHFNSTRLSATGKGWRPREIDSLGRFQQSGNFHGYDLQAPDFNWLHGPVINPLTRLCVIADAATSRLMVQGFEGMTQATDVFSLPANAG